MRLEVAGKVRYPDVSVIAGPVPGTVRTLRDAVVLFEVISPESAVADREQKRGEYGSLASIKQYVILEQSTAEATVLSRTAHGWNDAHVVTELNFPELAVAVPLAAIYRGVRFG